eukprot:CAMPEP_0179068228 /NCGR_PEP_ID=MMETSP0796-20121207/29896_1 /TAXON_ID=73915 /ORGANISM="Pyrodinium bahamense, Strain pbaha01" /LENGTH=90 /DNA_ID=CAMNT_0020765281 /DNA_START=9 /DNA_END=278 /DNA_ORIENTATION=-
MTAKQKRDTRYMFAESALSFARTSFTFCIVNGKVGTCEPTATTAAGATAGVVWAVVMRNVVVGCKASGVQPTTVPLQSVTSGPLTHLSGW